MNDFNSKRLKRYNSLEVSFSPSEVFPLLCPVREYDWLEGWTCRMIHSASGVAELGCVFESELDGIGRETWVVSRYEPDPGRIEFVRVADHLVTKLDIELEELGDSARIHWRKTFTGLNEQGNAWIDAFDTTKYDQDVAFLERALNHFLKTGTQLSATPGAA